MEDVDAVVRHRIAEDGACEYLVRWADEQQTWEPAAGLAGCEQSLGAYWRSQVASGGPTLYLEAVALAPVSVMPVPAPARSTAKRPRAAPVDKIAVAKRVQASKQLGQSLARSAVGPSTLVKPPPLNAKRSSSMAAPAPAATPVTETAGLVSALAIGQPRVQMARKSTGGRRPPPPTQ
ncbi:hypothetical protein H4R19_005028 [Coemansia spiralis]|nr:hypothetical protein H4R19_005028 [Coemansia spiralis]